MTRFVDKIQMLVDAFHQGKIKEDVLAAHLQIALYEKVTFLRKMEFSRLTQSNGQKEGPEKID